MTYAFVRILAGSFLIAWGAGVSGAIGGGAIAVIVSVFLAVFVIKDVYSYERSAMEVKAKKFLASFLPIIGAMLILYIIMNIDLIIARRKFIPTIAGDYSCAAFLGKIIFFFPQAIAMVLFPKFFEVKSDQEGLFRLLKKGCFLTVVASLGLSLFFILFPRPLISILYGSDYLGAASILWVFCLSMTGYATVNLLLYYFLSINRLGFMIRSMLLAIVLEILFMYIVASSPFQMASIHLITNAVIFIISFFGIKP